MDNIYIYIYMIDHVINYIIGYICKIYLFKFDYQQVKERRGAGAADRVPPP